MPQRLKETGTYEQPAASYEAQYSQSTATSGSFQSVVGKREALNTSNVTFHNNTASTGTEESGWIVYGFDTSSIPADAPAIGQTTTIDSYNLKGKVQSARNSNGNTCYVYLATDPTGINQWTVLTNKPSTTSTTRTSLTANGTQQINRSTVDDLHAVVAQACQNMNRNFSLYGLTLTINYSVYETFRTLDVDAGENGTCAQAGFREQLRGVDDDTFTLEFLPKSLIYSIDYILDNGVRKAPTRTQAVAGKTYYIYDVTDWSENHVIEAVWKLDIVLVDHDITFKIGDVYYDRITTPGYEVLELPESPEAPEGQAFAGWYYDKAFSRKFTEIDYANKALDSDISVYARFVIVKEPHTITCMYIGVPYGSVTTSGYEEITLPDGPTVELGYEFAGWYTDENFTIKVENDYYLERPLLKDIVLYGKVQESTTGPFKIEITAVDGTIISAPIQADWDEDIVIRAQSNDSSYGLRYVELNGNDFDMGTNADGRVVISYDKIMHPDNAVGVFHLNNNNDDSLDNCTASGYGNPAFTTTQRKFGTHAIQFSGSNYLSIILPEAFKGDESADSAFTIDMWVYNTANAANGQYPTVFSSYTADGAGQANNGPFLALSWARTDTLQGSENGSTTARHTVRSSALSRNTWHHIAFCREGKQYWWFIDGALANSGTNTLLPSTVQKFIIGGAKSNTADTVMSGYGFRGYIDEIRISKGALWKAAFTVPTAEYNAYYDKLYTIQANDIRHNVSGTAYFGPLRNFNVTASASGGTISPTSATVQEGNSLDLTFRPNTSGKQIKALLVDGVAVDLTSDTTYTLRGIHSDKTVKASYDPILYLKVGDTWKVISKLYIKENGRWVEKPIAGTLSEEEPYAQMPLENN